MDQGPRKGVVMKTALLILSVIVLAWVVALVSIIGE